MTTLEMIKAPYSTWNEDKIERQVERTMDRLDQRLLSGQISSDEYSDAVTDLDHWAQSKYLLIGHPIH